jgi:catechol 2,3-dioxygenase-like lactoylglutathione lyase family enzyme
MTRIKMVHHINVQITDRQRTREWYEKVLGATFLDRGPALNKRMLQLNIGNAEMHFSETDEPRIPIQAHFALEVADWDATLAHLEALGVAYSRTGRGAFERVGTGDAARWGKREDNGEHYTYIHDPDGNLIELVFHPLGLADGDGNAIAVEARDGLHWRQRPEVEAELGKTPAVPSGGAV